MFIPFWCWTANTDLPPSSKPYKVTIWVTIFNVHSKIPKNPKIPNKIRVVFQVLGWCQMWTNTISLWQVADRDINEKKNLAPQQRPAVQGALDHHWQRFVEIREIYPDGLSMNFFFGFNNAQLVRKLVQAVSRFQPSSPHWQQSLTVQLSKIFCHMTPSQI